MNCIFCGNTFSSKYSLANHQTKAKYCIEKQKQHGINISKLHSCQYCSRIYDPKI